ncbi:hypothetical protein N7497_012033 [Penicillium chrysogenum]|jgi:hypothetical protein|nr:hypothetical protein N7497_012033 [Penicillium chrysogenum]
MSALAVPQPTRVALEATEQVLPASALSEPAVPKPAQADSDEIDTFKTEQVRTEAALSEPAVPEPTQAAPEPTSLRVNVSDDVLGVPAPSEPAQIKSAHATPLWTERVRRVHVVPEPTLSGSDRAVPSEWTDTQSRASSPKGQELAAAPLQEDGSQDTMELVTDEDIDMDWDEEPVITPNQDALAAPSQASAEHASPLHRLPSRIMP